MIKLVTEIQAELHRMLVSIGPFTSWHVSELEKTAKRYFAILRLVSGMDPCSRGCTSLNLTSGSLAGFMAVSNGSGTACTYNRASFELTSDIEDLLGVLGRCA